MKPFLPKPKVNHSNSNIFAIMVPEITQISDPPQKADSNRLSKKIWAINRVYRRRSKRTNTKAIWTCKDLFIEFLKTSNVFRTTCWGSYSYDKGHNPVSRANFGGKIKNLGFPHKLSTNFPWIDKLWFLPMGLFQRKFSFQQDQHSPKTSLLDIETLGLIVEIAIERVRQLKKV